jgi:hypothetical protein
MRNLTFRPHIISNAWKLAGLFPYNSKRVLDQMEVMSTPEPEPLSFSESFISSILYDNTPKTLIAHEQYSSYINYRLASTIDKTIELSPTVARAIEKRDKGARTMLLGGILANEELQTRKEAEAEKASRRARNRTVQKYGVISVGDARLRVIARDEAEDRQIELHNLRQEEKEQERRAIADRKEKRLQRRQTAKLAKDKRLAEREAKREAKELADIAKEAAKEARALEKARKEAIKAEKAALRLASTQ